MPLAQFLSDHYPTICQHPHIRRKNRSTYLIDCKEDTYLLIKTGMTSEESTGWNQNVETLTENGFANLAQIVKTSDDTLTIRDSDAIWIMQRHYPLLDLHNPENMQKAARILASLHLFSKHHINGYSEQILIHGNITEESWLVGPQGEILLGQYQRLKKGRSEQDLSRLLLLAREISPDRLGEILAAYNSILPHSEPKPAPADENIAPRQETPDRQSVRLKSNSQPSQEDHLQKARLAFQNGHLREEDSKKMPPEFSDREAEKALSQKQSEPSEEHQTNSTGPLNWSIPSSSLNDDKNNSG